MGREIMFPNAEFKQHPAMRARYRQPRHLDNTLAPGPENRGLQRPPWLAPPERRG
jgi:hypothetical protein